MPLGAEWSRKNCCKASEVRRVSSSLILSLRKEELLELLELLETLGMKQSVLRHAVNTRRVPSTLPRLACPSAPLLKDLDLRQADFRSFPRSTSSA